MLILGLSGERRGAIWSLSSESASASEEGADTSRTMSSTTWSDALLDSEDAVAISAFRFHRNKYKKLKANRRLVLLWSRRRRRNFKLKKPPWKRQTKRQWLERDGQWVLLVDRGVPVHSYVAITSCTPLFVSYTSSIF